MLVVATLKDIGLLGEGAHILSTPVAVITGLTYDALPWMALPIYVALEKIDRDQVEAAADLYASGWQQFRRVILPLSAPGVYAGILLVGIANIGDYLSAQILGGPSTTMIGNIIQTQYVQNGDYPVASALSLVLMAALLLCVFVYAKVVAQDGLGTVPVLAIAIGDISGKGIGAGAAAPVRSRPWTRFLLPTYVFVVMAYTLVPIAVMVLYTFNKAPNQRLTFAWQGFTTEWYGKLFEVADLTQALVHSLEVATISSIIATALGTPAAMALARRR